MSNSIRILLTVLLILMIPRLLLAQSNGDTSQTGQSTENRIAQAPVPGSPPSSQTRLYSPERIFGRSSGNSVDYDLKERPAAQAPQFKLSTTIETKVENKTTNHIGSNSTPGATTTVPPNTFDINQEPVASFEFAEFVRSSVGNPLTVFGADLSAEGKYGATIDPLTVPTDYRVGPGDELIIRAWGQIDIDFQGPIDRSGQIFLTKIGNVNVAGQKLSELSALLRTIVGKQFRDFELTVTLGVLRQIQYYVMGFAKAPGVYTAPSTSSALHGLLIAGGISSAGDPRRIEIRRAGSTVATIDAYRFFIDGDKTADPQLQPGDVLYIPSSNGYSAIAGSVRRPAIFHIGNGMTLADLVKSAGGISLSQTSPSVRLERFKEGRRHIEHLRYNEEIGKRAIQDGDLYMVLPVSPRFDASITLRGNVAQPLRQPWKETMRISDVLGSSDVFIRAATWSKRNARENLAKIGDPKRDNELKRDFPDMEWDYAAIERIDTRLQSLSIITFNLGKALQKDSANDLILEPGDTVVVFAKADFRQPEYKKFRMVRIEGEVKFPGVYPISLDETLSQVIDRAGGVTAQGYVYGTVFSRASTRKLEAYRLQQVADRVEQDYLRYLAGRSRNALSPEEASVSSTEFEAVRSLVGRLRAYQPEGRIPLNLNDADGITNGFPAVVLEDDDQLLIPNRPATVTVVGAVFQEGSLLWQPNWNSADYIENAGGFRRHADNSGVVVIHANGTVRQAGRWLGRGEPVHAGDTVIVPENVELTSLTRMLRDWSQIFYQLGLGSAALKILKQGL
jgi:polysaccharide biosynthesis/export protein